ncbi:MAG: cell wall hydrolase [Erythrobacter sp.]|uniref:cell wall hydrolase n=1 Tax=Erythrobacter sp. TaxID=1042 RepID=UPI0032EE3B31
MTRRRNLARTRLLERAPEGSDGPATGGSWHMPVIKRRAALFAGALPAAPKRLAQVAAGFGQILRNLPFRSSPPYTRSDRRPSLKGRLAVLILAIAVPALAAPGSDLGGLGGLPPDAQANGAGLFADEFSGAAREPMPFERPGMSFPGSAFYHLADPPEEAALIALPGPDPLGHASAGAPGASGRALDPGPSALPFLAAAANPQAERCLAEAVFYEAAGESEPGQRAVAQVVLNRVRHPAWPGSVCGVVFQGAERATGCQFTFTCDGSRERTPRGAGWARARRIARAALAGAVQPQVGLATHYHALWVTPRWAEALDPVGTIGAHRFYRARGPAGSLAAFDAAYAGIERGAPTAPAARRASPRPSPSRAVAPSPSVAAAPGGPVAPRKTAAGPISTSIAEPAQGSGSVRAEYRGAGRWKLRPEEAARRAPRIAVDPAIGAGEEDIGK